MFLNMFLVNTNSVWHGKLEMKCIFREVKKIRIIIKCFSSVISGVKCFKNNELKQALIICYISPIKEQRVIEV